MKLEKTRENILEVARKLFDKFGYDKTSMNDIAHHSHKAKGSIYYNFNGKIDIFKELIQQEFESIRTNLTETCDQFNIQNGRAQIEQYLRRRMELFDQCAMIKQTITAQYYGALHEILTVTEEVRKDFDAWEWNYFNELCNKGKEYAVLNSNISPKAFADMLQMLLKALEIQFFAQDRYKDSKTTYESMIDFLLGNIQNA